MGAPYWVMSLAVGPKAFCSYRNYLERVVFVGGVANSGGWYGRAQFPSDEE
jgi:hypothetical protein